MDGITVQLLAVSPRTGRLDSDTSSSAALLARPEDGIDRDRDPGAGGSSCAQGLDSLGPLANVVRPRPPASLEPPARDQESLSGCPVRVLVPPEPVPVPELVDATRDPISLAAPERALMALDENWDQPHPEPDDDMAPPDDSAWEDEVPVRRPELWMVDGEDEKRAAGKDD